VKEIFGSPIGRLSLGTGHVYITTMTIRREPDDRGGEDILAILESEEVREIFLRQAVDGAYLFGSRASGKADRESDIDLAVLFGGRGDPAGRFEAITAISLALQPLLPAPLDILALDDADPIVAFDAVIGGREVYRRDGADLFPEEMRIRRRYDEARHIQGFFTAALRERVKR